MNRLVFTFLVLSSALAHAVDSPHDSKLVKRLQKNLCAPQSPETATQKAARIKTELEFYRFLQEKRGNEGRHFDPEATCGSQDNCALLEAELKSAQEDEANSINSEVATIEKQNELVEFKQSGRVSDAFLETVRVNRSNIEYYAKYYRQVSEDSKKSLTELMSKPANKITSNDEDNINYYNRSFAEYDKMSNDYSELLKWLDNGGAGWLEDNYAFEQYVGKISADTVKASQNAIISSQDKYELYNQRIKETRKRAAEIAKNTNTAEQEAAAYKDFEQQKKWVIESLQDRDGFNRCGMSVAEVFVIYDYTGSGYSSLNHSLRSGSNEYKIYLTVLNNALKKLAPYKEAHPVLRGAGFSPEFIAKLVPGKTLDYTTPVSTGLFNSFSGDVEMIIRSKSGRYVEPFSGTGGEEEVLFPSPTRFKIIKRTKRTSGRIILTLEEISPGTDQKSPAATKKSKKSRR